MTVEKRPGGGGGMAEGAACGPACRGFPELAVVQVQGAEGRMGAHGWCSIGRRGGAVC